MTLDLLILIWNRGEKKLNVAPIPRTHPRFLKYVSNEIESESQTLTDGTPESERLMFVFETLEAEIGRSQSLLSCSNNDPKGDATVESAAKIHYRLEHELLSELEWFNSSDLEW